MDDDIRLLPESLLKKPWILDADIVGFKLLLPTQRIQHAGGIYQQGEITHRGYGQIDMGQFKEPQYVCHVTTSMAFIKRKVFEKIGLFAEDYPGLQFEDVDFSFRALKAGFKILYWPSPVIHLESQTKRTLPEFNERFLDNYVELKRRYLNGEFINILMEYPKHYGGSGRLSETVRV